MHKIISLTVAVTQIIFYFGLLNAQDLNKSTVDLIPDYSFVGQQRTGRIGYYLASAGDVNKDGFGDFMIGCYHNDHYGWNSGAVFLMLGRKEIPWGLSTSINIADAIFSGKKEYDMVGYNMAGEGDFNGDGIDDILIGAPGNWERKTPIPGSVYIVFGKQNADWGKDFILEDYADQVIVGENDLDQFGYAVSFIGDINGDGCDDILVGAPFRTQNKNWDGKVYLILGRKDNSERRSSINEVTFASFIYSRIEGTLGSSVTGVGDVNQDGLVDFLLGAPGIGTCFLMLGKPNLDWGNDFNLKNADCIFHPERDGDDGGWQVKKAGDVNRDGFPDFLISGLEMKFGAGKTYLFLGRKNWLPQEMSMADADASYIGEGTNQHSGVSINGIEDFNGDGFDDFMIGARWYKAVSGSSYYHKGKAYIIFGKSNDWQRDVSLHDIDTYFIGEDTINCAGWGVSSAGDVNGDYRNDIIISAPFNSETDKWSGKVYLFLGNYELNQISGQTIYYANNYPVPGVILTLSGEADDQKISDGNGQYQFNFSAGNDFTVTPTKPKNSDIGYKSITTYDAALTAIHAVSLDTLNDLAQLAADVDQNQEITMYDAALIANFAVNLPPQFDSHAGEWQFDPPSRIYSKTELPRFDQNFSCILLGEVSGNWSLNSDQAALQKLISQALQISQYESLTIPLRIDSNQNMISTDIQLSFDPAVLEFVSIQKTALTTDFHLIYNDAIPGKLFVGMYGFSPIAKSGEIIHFEFKLINQNHRVSHLTIEKFQINNYPPTAGDILLNISAVEESSIATYQLYQNYPNPFNPQTTIEYHLNSPTEVKLIILNLNGQRVKLLEAGMKGAGTHRIVWSGVDDAGAEVSNGVYICSLKCNDFVYQKKMLKLK